MGLVKKTGPDALRAVPDDAVDPREHPRDLAGLLAALESASSDTRRWAAMDLAGEPAAISALAARLAHEPSRAVRDAIVVALVETGGEDVARALVPHLRSEQAIVRNAAVGALAGLAATGELVSDLLVDPDADVRVLCVMVLATLPDPRVPEWLRQVIEHDDDANVCGCAVDVLAELAEPELRDALEALPARFPDDPFLSFAVKLAIDRLSGAGS
jgi:HEAT repeat protein